MSSICTSFSNRCYDGSLRRPRSLDSARQAASLPDAAGVEAEAELAGERERLLILLAVDAAGDLPVLAVPADFARDVVLPHQVQVRARAELLRDEAEDRLGFIEQPGHDQVPEDETAPRHAAVIHHEIADLAVHLDDRLAGDVRIVGALEIAPRRLVRP